MCHPCVASRGNSEPRFNSEPLATRGNEDKEHKIKRFVKGHQGVTASTHSVFVAVVF